MKKLGLVGGISWSSTIDYYRIINEETNRRLGGLHFAECIIYSLDFDNFRLCNARHDWDGTFRLLSAAVLSLKKAGAEGILLCANTAHIVAERVGTSSGLPLIDIREATAAAVKKQGLKTVGLLGTVYTMELDFYTGKLRDAGIETIIPHDPHDCKRIEETLQHELGKGICTESTKKEYLRIANKLIEQGAEGLILGCTEIPLLISQQDFSVPVFNTTRIHSEAAVAWALR